MLLSYIHLIELVNDGVITADHRNINSASIDITLQSTVMLENNKYGNTPVDLMAKESLHMMEYTMDEEGIILYPGQFILASSNEIFNLPNDISCEYKLKSSLARCGLNHMLAGWCDPGWTNSRLTLELHNCTQHHKLLLRPGMKIGQIVFFSCEEVPSEHSYAVKGQYNGQSKVTANKGLR